MAAWKLAVVSFAALLQLTVGLIPIDIPFPGGQDLLEVCKV